MVHFIFSSKIQITIREFMLKNKNISLRLHCFCQELQTESFSSSGVTLPDRSDGSESTVRAGDKESHIAQLQLGNLLTAGSQQLCSRTSLRHLLLTVKPIVSYFHKEIKSPLQFKTSQVFLLLTYYKKPHKRRQNKDSSYTEVFMLYLLFILFLVISH